MSIEEIKAELFIAQQIPNGFSWTITSRLGEALKYAEELFGKRDKEYTILGVEFSLNEIPQVWYPGNRKDIIIQLSKNALTDVNQALYQMSHEVIHCLAPTNERKANILEEGLATYFSELYMKKLGSENWYATDIRYIEAINLVKALLGIDFEIIRKVRAFQPAISSITPEDFLRVTSKIPSGLSEKLCKSFY